MPGSNSFFSDFPTSSETWQIDHRVLIDFDSINAFLFVYMAKFLHNIVTLISKVNQKKLQSQAYN